MTSLAHILELVLLRRERLSGVVSGCVVGVVERGEGGVKRDTLVFE